MHQNTCIDTPQQNWVIENKIRHLLDVPCTIIFHMNVPLRFYEDVDLTVCYLINRLPYLILILKLYTLC